MCTMNQINLIMNQQLLANDTESNAHMKHNTIVNAETQKMRLQMQHMNGENSRRREAHVDHVVHSL